MKRGVLTALVAIVTFVIIVYVAVQFTGSPANTSREDNPSNIEISQYEERVFKTLSLKNGLKVVLVSDASTDKAAAALNVFSGSWANPTDIPGMAHFLEHMLFLGTEKFPEVDGYQTFIEQNGGMNNAYTSYDNTLYFFDIKSDQLAPALDRFSQFFIAPLFDSDFSDRERNAVNSEFSASIQNDERRIEDAVREQVNSNHPASRLSIGTLETLGVPALRDRLLSFFNKHYVASNMSLTLYGPQDIETLESWAKNYFGSIRTFKNEPTVYDLPMFDSSKLPTLVEIKPRKEMRRLELRFPIPETASALANKPHRYIAHLLGHESTGSLLSVLKEKGWAEALGANSGGVTQSNTTFDVSIELTPSGLENWQAVAEMFFSTVSLIRAQGVQEWIYQEQKNINEISFQFAEKVSPSSTAVSLAERLRYYPAEQLLSGPYRLGEFVATDFEPVLDKLTADNVLIVLTHPEANTDTKSEYYKTQYQASILGGNTVAAWRNPTEFAELAIPTPNPFVPTELSVLELEHEPSSLFKFTPKIIAADEHKTVWFEQDDEFRTPKIDIHLLLETDFANANPEQAIAVALYLRLVNDALNEVRYEAGLAGSGYGISLTDKGIQIRLYGYQNKVNLLFDALLLEISEHEITTERFNIIKDEMLRGLRNRSEDPVINQMVRELNEWMVSNTFSNKDQLAALKTMSAERLLEARTLWMADSHLTFLIHGNLLTDEALELAERVDSILDQSGGPSVGRSIADLPKKQYLQVRKIDHADSALLQLYQGDNSSLRERAIYRLLAETMSAPYFAELRTREQLGYIVLARPYPMDGLPGLILYVQSPTADPALIQLYSNRFLSRYAQQLSEMNDKQFESYKEGLITSLKEPTKNLYQLSNRYWSNIQVGNSNFNTHLRLANEVSKISLDGFRRFFDNRIIGDQKSLLAIHQVGKGMATDYNKHDDNIIGFHRIDDPKQWPKDVTWVAPKFNNQAE